MTVPEISKVFGYHRNYVSKVIHNFNKDGFKYLKSKYENCGRKPVISEEIKQKIADVALTRPKDLGLPFTQWSLSIKRLCYRGGNCRINQHSGQANSKGERDKVQEN